MTVVRPGAGFRAIRSAAAGADVRMPPPCLSRLTAPCNRESADLQLELETREATIGLRARERSLGLGTLLIAAGIVAAVVATLTLHDGSPVGVIGGGLAPAGLVGGGITLIRFSGRPPDSGQRSPNYRTRLNR